MIALLVIFVLAQTPPAPPTGLRDVTNRQPEWKAEQVKAESMAKTLDRRYVRDGCVVFTRRDGRGVEVHASKREGSYSFSTQVNLLDGKVTAVHNNVADRIMPIEDPKPPDMTTENGCWEKARSLPPEVRKLFFGYEGIK